MWAATQSVVSGARDTEQLAQKQDRVAGPLRFDEPESAHRILSSLPKKAAAFSNLALLFEDTVFLTQPAEVLPFLGAKVFSFSLVDFCWLISPANKPTVSFRDLTWNNNEPLDTCDKFYNVLDCKRSGELLRKRCDSRGG